MIDFRRFSVLLLSFSEYLQFRFHCFGLLDIICFHNQLFIIIYQTFGHHKMKNLKYFNFVVTFGHRTKFYDL